MKTTGTNMHVFLVMTPILLKKKTDDPLNVVTTPSAKNANNHPQTFVSTMTEKPRRNWNVQKLLSIVPDLVQEVADAAVAEHKSHSPKNCMKSLPRKGSTTKSEPELVTERHLIKGNDCLSKGVIDQVPNIVAPEEEDWEILSEKASFRSFGGDVIVARAGSVRSIDHESSSHTTLSLPFKIQRTASSSTLD